MENKYIIQLNPDKSIVRDITLKFFLNAFRIKWFTPR